MGSVRGNGGNAEYDAQPSSGDERGKEFPKTEDGEENQQRSANARVSPDGENNTARHEEPVQASPPPAKQPPQDD